MVQINNKDYLDKLLFDISLNMSYVEKQRYAELLFINFLNEVIDLGKKRDIKIAIDGDIDRFGINR